MSFKTIKVVIFYFAILIGLRLGVELVAPKSGGSAREKREFIPPSQILKYTTFGFSEIIADALWLRLIQNFDDCSRFFSDSSNSFSIEEIDELSGRVRCKRSWTFRMLDSITDLAPRFRIPFATGGLVLSVLLDDYEGAKVIFDKAVIQFPKDWPILYRAAYHYLLDLKQPERAAELMLQAADHGAPYWLRFTAASILSQRGQAEFGLKVLEDYLNSTEDEIERALVKEKIRKIKESIDL